MSKIIRNHPHSRTGVIDTRRSHRYRRDVWLVMTLLAISAVGCATPPVDRSASALLAAQQRVLVVPFVDLVQIYGPTGMIQCPICPNYFAAVPVAPGAERFMTERLLEILKTYSDISVLQQQRPPADASMVENVRLWGQKERRMLSEAGRSAGVQLVVTGYIYRFEQRAGGSYAAATPASVAFSVHMLDAASGADKWYGTMDETQAALSENLLQFKAFIKRKGTWVTAEEMAAAGLEQLLGGAGQ